VQDHYLDTASQLLMRSGIACRLRQIGKRSSLTLKSLTAFHDGLADRVEITEELPDGNWAGPAPLPGSKLRAFLFPVTRHPIVKCLFTLDQKRRVYEVRTPDGTCLEVSADHVIFPGGSGKRLYRIEIELREGTAGSLSRFGASVRRSLGLTSADESKFDCGLRAAGIAIPRLREGPALTLRPGDPVQKAAARAFTRQYRRMLWHEPGTRLGINPESLHDMRVSVRRLRAVLRLFRPALPPATTAHLAAELKWLGRSLGAVRDLDVHLQECPVVLRSLSSPCRTAPEMCRLAMGQRRDQAYAALRLALRGRRFRSLKQSCRDFIRLMGTAAPGATNTAVADAALLKRGDLQTILRSGRDIDTDTPHETVHRLRVRCKRLRYACETLSSLYRKPVSKMAWSISGRCDGSNLDRGWYEGE
jgi:CHAD domain-containing protein